MVMETMVIIMVTTMTCYDIIDHCSEYDDDHCYDSDDNHDSDCGNGGDGVRLMIILKKKDEIKNILECDNLDTL